MSPYQAVYGPSKAFVLSFSQIMFEIWRAPPATAWRDLRHECVGMIGVGWQAW